MNKGLKLRFCKECNRKRFCQRIRIPGHNFRFICSKDHKWILKGITTERIITIMQDVLLDATMNTLFNRDNAFYRKLSKRK